MARTTKLCVMPDPQVYEAEYDFWPWGNLLEKVLEWIAKEAPDGAFVFDYMCGTGWLLHRLSTIRPDLTLGGCDVSETYITFGKKKYPQIQLDIGNALKITPSTKPDFIICMAGIHHLQPVQHLPFMNKVANELNHDGWFIVGEEVIRNWSNELERKNAVLELFVTLLRELIMTGAPKDQLEAAILVLRNDLFQRGEFKYSLKNLIDLFQKRFLVQNVTQVWPTEDEPFGDYLIFSKLR